MNRLVATVLMVATLFMNDLIILPSASASAQSATYGDAMRWYERETLKGTAKAQFLLGLLYERGSAPRKQDPEQAYELFLKAASKGHPRAQFKVAFALQSGRGVMKDLKLAHAWYRRSAAFGVPEAQYNLGYMLLNGEGAARSPEKAAQWYDEAARGGFGPAQLALGYLYLTGTGVVRDIADAWAWFRAAETRHIAGAAEARKSTGERLSQIDLKRGETLAASRLKK